LGIWRKGDLLVVHKDMPLPDICLKTGRPADRRIPLKVKWESVFGSKRFTIELPISDVWWLTYRRRRRNESIAIVALFGWLPILFCCTVANLPIAITGLLLVVFMLHLISLLAHGIAKDVRSQQKFVEPAKVGEHYVYLRRVHGAVLVQYPEWPSP
jgi:hypothetical protein